MAAQPTSSNPSSSVRQIFLYFGPLTLMVYLFAPESLLDIPTSYMLKDHLSATAPQVSMFRLLTGLRIWVSSLAWRVTSGIPADGATVVTSSSSLR
jgi:hypothetical protein